jgi:hypothetical protein
VPCQSGLVRAMTCFSLVLHRRRRHVLAFPTAIYIYKYTQFHLPSRASETTKKKIWDLTASAAHTQSREKKGGKKFEKSSREKKKCRDLRPQSCENAAVHSASEGVYTCSKASKVVKEDRGGRARSTNLYFK